MVTRIRQLLEHKQLTPTQFADLIGVGRPVVSHILSERNKPSLEVAQRIGSAFPDISLAWLMFGSGDMLAAEAASPSIAPAPVSEPPAPESVSEPALTPVSLPTPSPAVEVAPSATGLAPTPANPAPSSVELAPAASPVAPEARLRPFIASQPALAAALATEPALAALPEPAAPAEAAPGAVPAMPQPFRAARFVPAAQAGPAPAAQAAASAAAPVARAIASASTPDDTAAAALMPATAAALSTSANVEADMLPFLAESGKAIRRIVIFYRDGSFADYQPE